jgi:ribonuclease P protein component
MPPARGYARLRLRRGQDFRSVYASRRVRGGRLIAVHWRQTDLGHPRVGFSVSTRVGNAVERNRLKRCLREAARPRLAPLLVGIDLVIVVRAAAAGASCAELDREFGSLAGQVLG